MPDYELADPPPGAFFARLVVRFAVVEPAAFERVDRVEVFDLAVLFDPAVLFAVVARFEAVDFDERVVDRDAGFVDVVDVDERVDRRDVGFLSPRGRASPTALIAPLATSPTVPTTRPAVLPTAFTISGAMCASSSRSFDRGGSRWSNVHGPCRPERASGQPTC